jgi:type IV pilus assembly protein PilY1
LVSGGTLPNVWTNAKWKDFVEDTKTHGGWYYNFTDARERNLGQAALFGDLLTFTTYAPSDDLCEFEGPGFLYGLYYLTGTAGPNPVFINILSPPSTYNYKRSSLGPGLLSKPSIHVGNKDGSTAFVQSSDGAIFPVEELNPGKTTSGKTSWSQRE